MDFDWTDAGSPEDHAERIEALGDALMDKGLYKSSNDLYIAAQCIRGLDEEVDRLRTKLPNAMQSQLEGSQLGESQLTGRRIAGS